MTWEIYSMPKRTPVIRRVDGNQAEIVKALRAIGASVQPIHIIGMGCPDILVGFQGVNYLFEIKAEGGTLSQDEIIWSTKWQGNAQTVFSAKQAIDILLGGNQ
jgi:hypothetical protein